MSPVTHFLLGWLVANAGDLEKRDRAAVAIAAVAPDVDGLGAIVEAATRHSAHPLLWFSQYHHELAHNLGFVLVLCLLCLVVARKKWLTAGLAFAALHLHFLCDLIGARGPDGEQWPIPYLLPFSDRWQLVWQHQWALNAWPNFLITVVALGFTFVLAARRGFSPLELFSARADRALTETLRRRFSRRG